MKASFYFIIWIVIYPLLGLIGSPWINQNSFLVALIFVWALSWFINKTMPETIAYERKLEYAQIMNEVYTCNVRGFKRRLSQKATVEFIAAVYFGFTSLLTLYIMFAGNRSGFFELIIFGLLAAGTIMRAAKLQKYAWRLRQNPDPQECVTIVDEMGMDYASYYEERQNSLSGAILPPPPRHFGVFQVFSILIAAVCAILGIIFMVLALIGIFHNASFGATSYGIMYLLYGSLATYYGVKDCISSINYFKIKNIG